MNFTGWMQSHRRSILFLLFILALAGLGAAFNLPVTLFPTVDFPRVSVSLNAGDMPAEQMLIQVTRQVEEVVHRVPGVRDVRSTTSRGSADVSITMDWGIDMASAALQVNAAISRIMPLLPQGTEVDTRRMDPTVFPIIAYSIKSSVLSLVDLYEIAEYQIRPLLSSVEGVANVEVLGGEKEEYHVIIDPARLWAYELGINEVVDALRAANILSVVGRLEDHYKLYLIVSDSRFTDFDLIKRTVIKSDVNSPVFLEDIASVEKATVPTWTRVTADGRDAVIFQVYQQPGSNSVQIAKDIKNKLKDFSRHLPKEATIANWYDQSRLVIDSAASVRDAILIGIGLAVFVLAFFLRNTKIIFIAIFVVPATLSITILLLNLLGMSFNIMTLGGLAAAVGLVIDDSIVMVEQIVRRIRGCERSHHGVVMKATLEFFQPLSGSSAATLIIFLPLAFLTGVTGAFFKALSITMASALFISFLVTWLAVPLLADHLLNEKDARQKEGGAITDWIHRWYSLIMQRLITRPVLVLLIIIPLLIAGWLSYQYVGSGFMPAMDEGGFVLDYLAEPGTSLTETDRLLRQVEQILRDTPEVDTYSRRTGLQLGGGVTESREGDFFVRLKPPPRRPIEEIMDDIRNRIEKLVPGLEIEMPQLMEDLIGDLTAVPQPVEIKVFSDDPKELQNLAVKIAGQISQIPGIVEVRNGINPAGDALEIHIDQNKAAIEGIDPETVTSILETYLRGTVTTEINKGPKMIGVRIWTPQNLRDTDSDLAQLQLRAADGHLFSLRRIANIYPVTGQPQINRDNLKRMVAVTARISGRDMGSAIRDVRNVLNQRGELPKGVYYELGGLYRQQQIAFRGMERVFMAAVALVFLLLLFLYERFRVSLSIMAIPLLAVSAVFIGLWITGIEINISSIMGMTMIIGIVTEVAIFYFSEYHDLIKIKGMNHEQALVAAGRNRMRPIAMTTIATILTLLPLAFSIGEGSSMQQPLAVAIISGLMVQLPLVLLVMPVIYHLLEKMKIK